MKMAGRFVQNLLSKFNVQRMIASGHPQIHTPVLLPSRAYGKDPSINDGNTAQKNLNYMTVSTVLAITFGLTIALGLPHFTAPREYVREREEKDFCFRELESLAECCRTLEDVSKCDGLYKALLQCRSQCGD